MDDFTKMAMKKKGAEPMDQNYKDSKMSMLQALREEMSKLMSNDLKNPDMAKVTVMASDHDGDESEDMDSDEGSEGSEEASHGAFGDNGGNSESEEDGEGDGSAHGEDGSMHLSDEDIAHLEAMLSEAKAKRMQG
jgi:hypothetical protein